MYNKLKTLLRKVDFYLRNEEYRDPSQGPRTYPFSSLFDGPPDPWRTRVYWGVRRTFNRIWDFPGNVRRKIKFAYQRLTRGWDDRAVWSVDYWLDGMMPDILRDLKKYKHGIPWDMFEGLPTVDNDGYTHSDETFAIAEARWDAVLDKMIAAFEASARINGHDARDDDQAIFEEGMALFVKHYHSLWD